MIRKFQETFGGEALRDRTYMERGRTGGNLLLGRETMTRKAILLLGNIVMRRDFLVIQLIREPKIKLAVHRIMSSTDHTTII